MSDIQQNLMTEQLQKKWQPVIEHSDLEPIKDSYKRNVTTILLENQEQAMLAEASTGTAFANAAGGGIGFAQSSENSNMQGFDPVLISLVRRSMPNLMAYDVCGVQPMTGPTGLIFAMKSKYATQGGTEALFNEALTDGFDATAGGGTGYHQGATATAQDTTDPLAYHPASTTHLIRDEYAPGVGMSTANAEALTPNEMAFSITRTSVVANTRALKAEYTTELAQDLKAVHGLDAEAELANILSTEILAEINREVIRTIYKVAEQGAVQNTATAGIFDLDVDSNGRWSVEKFKGLLFQIERDANAIAQRTRRGKGNIVLCSADVASALTMAGILDYTPALNANLNVDDTGNTFAGVLQGKYRVYIDPFAANVAASQYYVMGYKGSSPYDAGLFYCPYVPLQMVRAVGENTFQPKIGFKTRYGVVANPFAHGTSQGSGALTVNANRYYRRVRVNNLM